MVLEVKIVVYLWMCEGAWVVGASRGLLRSGAFV